MYDINLLFLIMYIYIIMSSLSLPSRLMSLDLIFCSLYLRDAVFSLGGYYFFWLDMCIHK